MKNITLKRFGLKLVLLALLALPELADAQVFNYNQYGDVLAGFRKTGVNEGNYELVVDLGNVTNFVSLSIGTTINITNYTASQLTNAFTDTGSFESLQWSAFGAFPGSISPWVTPVGTYPKNTMWLTLPSTNVTTQTTPPPRLANGTQQPIKGNMLGVGTGAASISGFLNATNANNTTTLVREPVSYNQYDLTAYIGWAGDTTQGRFGPSTSTPYLSYVVENTTPSPFASPQRDDFYQLCPTGTTDPINGSTTNTYYIGYFILSPNGSMTFTRAAQTTSVPPVASFSGGPTTGFAGFSAVFTNTSTGTITNWVWNFGDGTLITNSTGGNVTHVYAVGGSYNVTLTVSGPGGSNGQTQPNLIVTSPLPTMIAKVSLSGGQLVLDGTNCPAGVPYRILSSTNVALSITSWTPVVTNVFLPDGSYSYTNSTAQKAAFFRLVSP